MPGPAARMREQRAPDGQRPAVERRQLRLLLQGMNAALRDSHGGSLVERFDLITEVLFTKLCDELEVQGGRKRGLELRVLRGDTPETLLERVTRVWRGACEARGLASSGPLTGDAPAMLKMVALLQEVSLARTPGDIRGLAYEELLRNTFEKNEHQQFFTPQEIVQFLVALVDPRPGERLCDPACGTGGFLVEMLKHGERGRAGGVELVGADVDQRLARTARVNLLMHGGEGDVRWLAGAGSLAPLQELGPALVAGSFDAICTNPPFGSDLSDEHALRQLETGRGRLSRRRGVLFTERCLELLRPGGRLGIVLDDGVLNAPTTADLREYVRRVSEILAVVSLPEVAFMPYSTARCSLLLLRKKGSRWHQRGVFMADAARVGRRPNGDALLCDERGPDGERIPGSDLPGIAGAFSAHAAGRGVEHARCFLVPEARLVDRLDVSFHHPSRAGAEAELASSRHPTPTLRELVTVRRETVAPAAAFGNSPVRWIGLADIEDATGEYEARVLSADRLRSQCRPYRAGDILLSRLRPELRKCVLIREGEEEGLCSAEMVVLRGHDPACSPATGTPHPCLSDYLTLMLRSELVHGQLRRRITGVGRPRVSLETVLELRIPVPPLDEQRRLVAELAAARQDASEARRQAAQLLERAERLVAEAYGRIAASLTREG